MSDIPRGRWVFPGDVGQTLSKTIEEARASVRAVRLSFETDDAALFSLPFEVATFPNGAVPSLLTNVRVVRVHTGARAEAEAPLAGPLRILAAMGAPDEEVSGGMRRITRPGFKPSWTPSPRPGFTAPKDHDSGGGASR